MEVLMMKTYRVMPKYAQCIKDFWNDGDISAIEEFDVYSTELIVDGEFVGTITRGEVWND